MMTFVAIAAQTADSAASAFELAALIPIGAVVSLIGVLVAAAWAARSAMIVRLLDAQRAGADRFAVFQQDAVAAINELGLSMARYAEQAQDSVARGAAQAIQAAPEPASGSIKFDVRLDPEWQARVVRATDAWRLILAQQHAYAGNGVHEALHAIDEQRAVVVDLLNAHRFADARAAADQLRGYEARQAYRRLQIVALERDVAMMRLVQTRWLRREIKRTKAFAIEQLERGENLIEDAKSEQQRRADAGTD